MGGDDVEALLPLEEWNCYLSGALSFSGFYLAERREATGTGYYLKANGS